MAARDRPARHRRGGRGKPLALATALFVGCALLATWPAVRQVDDRYLGLAAPGYGGPPAGDHLQLAWAFWLPGHQLEQASSPLRDPYSFQPEASAAPNLQGWLLGTLYWPLDHLSGSVLAYNLVVLTTFVLAGAICAWWLCVLGLGLPAALVGGVAFELAPYRVAQSTGHLLALISFLLPACLLCIERRRFVLAGLALAAIPLSGQEHLALGAIPLVVGYGFVRLKSRRQRLYVAGIAGAAVVAGLLVHRVAIDGTSASGGRSLAEVADYAATPADLLRRGMDHGLERFIFAGWVVPVVALLGLVLLLRAGKRSLALLAGLAIAIPYLLALGTNLPFNAYGLVRDVVFPLRYTRVPERLLPIACLALAALVAYAVSALPRRTWIVPAVLLVVAVDLRVDAFSALDADSDNAAYAAIRSNGAMLELPLFRPGQHYGSVYLAYAKQSPRQRPLGYATAAPPAAVRFADAHAGLSCGTGPFPAFVRVVTVHRPLYAQSGRYAPTCAQRAEAHLRSLGWRLKGRDRGVSAWSAP
jgi:hypothetical protein